MKMIFNEAQFVENTICRKIHEVVKTISIISRKLFAIHLFPILFWTAD